MSGIDERSIMSQNLFKLLCPYCEECNTILFKYPNRDEHMLYYGWKGRSAYMDWSSRSDKIRAIVKDSRTTYKSIGRHDVFCECGFEFGMGTRQREKAIKLFRSNANYLKWQEAEMEYLLNERNR